MPSNDQRAYRQPSARVHRTQTASDGALSPFILDPSSVKLSHRLSDTQYAGVWLRIPVSVCILSSRRQALEAVNHLNRLRHPHLEQLLGAVVDTSSQKFLVTESISGPSLHKLITSRSSSVLLSKSLALRIAVDVARAVVYYHSVTGMGLPSLCPHTIAYDRNRSRAVVQLSVCCPYAGSHGLPESGTGSQTCMSRGGRGRPSRAADVYSLARIIVAMFSQAGEECLRNEQVAVSQVRAVPAELRSCVSMCLAADPRDRLKMTQFCQILVESLEGDS